MTMRAAYALLIMSACLMGCSSKGAVSDGKAPVAQKEKRMQISTDIDRLGKHIELPAGLQTVRWLAAPRGSVGLGPTDLVLLARFELTPQQWAALQPKMASLPNKTLVVPEPVRSLVGRAELQGDLFQPTPFETIRWRDGQAVWDGTALTVLLFSS
jgi:hypothetical protein